MLQYFTERLNEISSENAYERLINDNAEYEEDDNCLYDLGPRDIQPIKIKKRRKSTIQDITKETYNNVTKIGCVYKIYGKINNKYRQAFTKTKNSNAEIYDKNGEKSIYKVIDFKEPKYIKIEDLTIKK